MNKTKITLLVALGLLFSTAVNAQNVRFGVKGGLNYTTISADDNPDGIGYHFGGTMDVGTLSPVNFRSELLVSVRTVTSEYTVLGEEYKFSATPVYVTVPLLAKFNPTNNFSFLVGPQLGFLASNEYTVTNESGDGMSYFGDGVDDDFRESELALALGGEFGMTENVDLGLRYVRGLQSRTESSNADDYYNILQFGVTYKF